MTVLITAAAALALAAIVFGITALVHAELAELRSLARRRSTFQKP